MNYFIYLLVLLCISYVKSDDCACGNKHTTGKIIGGKTAAIHPWMAAIAYRFGRHFCGGALINDKYIITAAHCLARRVDKVKHTRIILGLNNLSNISSSSPHLLPVSKIIIHEDYDDEDHRAYNDIALIRLENPISFTKDIQPICLPSSDVMNFTNLMVTGWGKISNDNETKPFDLMEVTIPQRDESDCLSFWKRNNYGFNQICAGELGKDSCGGDSGGPLVSYINGKANIVGLVSYGHKRCGSSWPAVYTRVNAYLNWIKENTKDGNFCKF